MTRVVSRRLACPLGIAWHPRGRPCAGRLWLPRGVGKGLGQCASLAAPRSDTGLWVCVATATGLMGGCVSAGLARSGLISRWESRMGLVGGVLPGAPLGTSPCRQLPGWGPHQCHKTWELTGNGCRYVLMNLFGTAQEVP